MGNENCTIITILIHIDYPQGRKVKIVHLGKSNLKSRRSVVHEWVYVKLGKI